MSHQCSAKIVVPPMTTAPRQEKDRGPYRMSSSNANCTTTYHSPRAPCHHRCCCVLLMVRDCPAIQWESVRRTRCIRNAIVATTTGIDKPTATSISKGGQPTSPAGRSCSSLCSSHLCASSARKSHATFEAITIGPMAQANIFVMLRRDQGRR